MRTDPSDYPSETRTPDYRFPSHEMARGLNPAMALVRGALGERSVDPILFWFGLVDAALPFGYASSKLPAHITPLPQIVGCSGSRSEARSMHHPIPVRIVAL